jgi:polysaccharide chain length determinant protein (PEP-CTERM system associated)
VHEGGRPAMNQLAEEALSVLRAVWRRRWLAVAAAWVAAIVGIIGVSVVPDRWEASARIYVDTQTVLKPLMQGLAFQPDTDQQLKMLARTIVSRPNIEQLLKRQAEAGFKGVDTQHSVDRLIERIKVDASGGNLYTISFRDTDSRRAQAVVKGLVDLFVDTGTVSEQKDSTEAGKFIDDQIKVYEQKLSEAENRLKDFKVRNFSISGVSNQDYFARTSQISDEVTRLKIAYEAAERSRDALRHELAGEDPHLPAGAQAANGLPPAPSEIDSRIAAQKRELDELLRKYTDQHPDVIAARNTIRQLEAQKATERSSGGDHAGAAATSPVYQQLRVQLAQDEANVASLGSQLAAQQQRLDQLHATATKVPEAEAELAQLNRDYDVIRHNYELLVSRREAASLGVKMDQSAQLADFRVIEPPRVSPKPVFPDRSMLTLVAMVASLAIGVAVAYGLALLHPTFSSAHALKEFTHRPVIGTISIYSSSDTVAASQVDLRRVGLAMLAFFLVQGAWIAWVFSHRGP